MAYCPFSSPNNQNQAPMSQPVKSNLSHHLDQEAQLMNDYMNLTFHEHMRPGFL